MTSCQLFESLASATWCRVRDGYVYRVRQGEEGLSDWLLLDLVAANLPDVRIVKTNKKLEATRGTDWEWWLGNLQTGWLRYAVQAKVIDVSTRRFDALNHKVNGTPQLDVLRKYARRQRAMPIYCLYSFVDPFPSPVPSCGFPSLLPDQYGCSVLPEATIRSAARKRGAKTFESLYRTGTLYPWRCLVCCPLFNPGSQASNPLRPPNANQSFLHEALPEWLASALETPWQPTTPPSDLFPDGPAARFVVASIAAA